MRMPCKITDEWIYNMQQDAGDPEITIVKSLEELSLSELMGEDLTLWIGKNKEFGYVMELEDEKGSLISDKCIHPLAMESLASFCRNFLGYYNKLSELKG